jgi:putative tricarboxylic transport membrane protein
LDTLAALANGFLVAATPYNLLWAAVGVTIGTAIGALPGLGPSTTVALLMPLTYNVSPTAAFIMFAGIYYGSQYGGSTASILLNTPGEPGAMMTAVDGNAMARRGRGAQALATAAIGSFVAGTIGTIALTFVAPLMVTIALALGAPEYFSLMVLALATVTAVISGSPAKGLASMSLGLLLGSVGLDPQTGQPRFTFGILELLDGIDITIVAVGLFAVGETLYVASQGGSLKEEVSAVRGSFWMSADDWRRSWKPWLRGTAFGFPIGALPAGGAEVPTMLSYATEKRLSKHPEEFGKGAIEGVAGPEAANNASAAGALAPLLALGLPTSATTAVLLAAFEQYGIRPGPLLFDTNPELVWGMIASLYIGNVLLLVLNLPLVGIWVRLLSVPKQWLYAGIMCFATLGAYTLNNNAVDIGLLWLIGLLGFGMRMLNVPIVPCVLGFVLGPMLELMMRRSLAISQGDPTIFLTRPVSASLLLLAVALLVGPMILKLLSRPRTASAQAVGGDPR